MFSVSLEMLSNSRYNKEELNPSMVAGVDKARTACEVAQSDLLTFDRNSQTKLRRFICPLIITDM